ncbi:MULTISPECIES: M20/M25/M40 family metallo-hydrolase [Bacillaceae]|uniref:M20/M25/M40 family metallo-hydrolase n=1 Tax=Bacillaceae TaxID=186817 RepID=UPI001E4CE76A|nr:MULTISPECIES: M20/M25/M40 family metallo-hydrolase [Bacillaceae]MCE4050125.1 M20/M25/M40 family metallo-hydrolase [Bacillus sp. Au-Bac7]MCM3031563.1 M20/M25/M40 family metallo-hydrolase [Niallia sp. MER 6]MDL0435510.1 M20/M25/M40 family metallo-hydrolase [Niallia sp. SS-2023]UPO88169.1 M20/M25/M40 family metallo-hydrolase [Niallia sp. Man26]
MREQVAAVKTKGVFDQLLEHSLVQKGLEYLLKDADATLEEQIELTKIPAPSFMEAERGRVYKAKLELLGLDDIQEDRHGNVFGIRPGTGKGPRIFVCAHLDTVFPNGTDIVVRRENGKVFAPGISDDGRGLAAVLTLVRAFNETNIQTEGDIIFGATVGEEGLGDLRGVKGLFADRTDIDGFISIEPGHPERITYLGTGSHRFHITYKGSGGHSFGDFGIPSPIHALGRAISKIGDIKTPDEPKTTFNVGTITGGTSVNTIAEEASMMLDMRSNSAEELIRLEEQVMDILHNSAEEENNRWNSEKTAIEVTIKQVGDRPAGAQSPEGEIVQTTIAAAASLGLNPVLSQAFSTDSNVPISLGIPAVTLGGGGSNSGGFHTLEEYFDPTDAHIGPQNIFLTILGLVGMRDVTAPLLSKK